MNLTKYGYKKIGSIVEKTIVKNKKDEEFVCELSPDEIIASQKVSVYKHIGWSNDTKIYKKLIFVSSFLTIAGSAEITSNIVWTK